MLVLHVFFTNRKDNAFSIFTVKYLAHCCICFLSWRHVFIIVYGLLSLDQMEESLE